MRRILTVAAMALGCGSTPPTAPSPPTPPAPAVLTGISIVPPLSEVTLGKAVTLQAIGRFSDGREQAMAATWRTDNPIVLEADGTGALTTHRLGAATITANVEQFSDARRIWVTPVPDAPWQGDFSGTWDGQFRTVTCDRISGPGPSVCRSEVGGIFPIRLELAQQRNSISGSFGIYSNLKARGTVTGWVDGAGNLVLDGMFFLEEGDVQGRVYNWGSHLDSTGRMIGAFSTNERFTNAFGPQVLELRAELIGLTRSSTRNQN